MRKSRNEYYKYIMDEISIKEVCDKLRIVTNPVGEDYVCSCIYHNDPHPSMHIYCETRRFYCFECNRGGNLYTLLEHSLKDDFNGVLRWLEREYPHLLKEKPRINAKYDNAFGKSGYEIAFEKYAHMTKTEENGLEIFARERGYKADFLKESDVFYAKGQKIHSAYTKNADNNIEEIEKLKESRLIIPLPKGLREYQIRYEDYFRKDRVIITLRDSRGKICGFAGKSVRDDDKPKYLFTKGLPKSQILYRLDAVEKKLRNNREVKKLFIVEGVFDALRLESMGYYAVAVLGSRLVDKQVEMLENTIDRAANITLSLFLDMDTAGLNGTIASIKKIWKSKILKKCYLEIQVLKDGTKDPDEAFKEIGKVKGISYSSFEFLLRYYLKSEGQLLDNVDLQSCYANLNTEERISLLHKMEDILPRQEWEELFDYYDRVIQNEDEKKDNNFSYFRIRSFILGNSETEVKAGKNATHKKNSRIEEEKDFHYQMQMALQITRTSYGREEVSLDTTTWERIALGADAFFDYLIDILKKEDTINIPLLTMKVPKKLGVTRTKSMYCHEELLLQQYVLTELLSRGAHEGFERNVPAVRYDAGGKTYITGYQYPDLMDEPVSFAYQIDMAAISGTVEIKQGMYRPFYDCWKSYIGYIQNGIEKLEGDRVYRVKLDVQKFYDELRKYVIRNAIYPPIAEAVSYDEEKFKCFRNESETSSNVAERVVDWILKELYKVHFYDSKDGILKQKSEYDCGIPQGPNLSSYIANVALFSVDYKAQEIVRAANAACKEGEIKARYARYVDDMIIVASTPDILLSIKRAIVSQLYELELNLSPKTGDEDSLTKEEAFAWTLEERGGFGVSAGFDMPDDTITSLMETYEDYEVTDRRDALKLLQNSMNELLYNGIESREENWETFSSVFFQTEEIRYLDIVRFAEMMLYQATKQGSDLIDKFSRMWKEGIKQNQNESLFLEEGLEVLVFLDACRRVLQRQENSENPESYHLWEAVNKNISNNNQKINHWVYDSISGKRILEENSWILQLKIIEFGKLTNSYVINEEFDKSNEMSGKNEYWYRWCWHVARNRTELTKLSSSYSDMKEVVQEFHFFIESLRKIEKIHDYDDLMSILSNYNSYYKLGENALLNCFECWASKEEISAGANAERALRVLLNVIPANYKAEIIDKMKGLKQYLFLASETNYSYEYLPVFPGVSYPGLMRTGKNKIYIDMIERVDLDTGSVSVLNQENWVSSQDNSCRAIFVKKQDSSQYKNISLNDYCQSFDNLNAQKALEIIVDIYPKLYKKLLETNEKIESKQEKSKLILSSRNVVLAINGEEVQGVDVENAYLISSQTIPDVVAIDKGNVQYQLKVVYEKGACYWISGYLLEDACRVDDIKFKALSLEKEEIYDAEMLKFTMKRLCGYSFQVKGNYNHTGRSYEKSIIRTINLVKNYLTCNDDEKKLIFEEAKIVNSFIKTLLENDYGEFLDCSWGCAIWAKTYLRTGFNNLKSIIKEQKEFTISNCEEKRRVPKWYYCLAEQIEEVNRITDKNYGLKALAAGIYADAVLILMRMQVLECIRALEDRQLKEFLEESNDLPFMELEIDNKAILITEGEICTVYQNLLSKKREEGIKKITHLGWLLLLAKIYEIDKQENFIVADTNRRIDRDKLRSSLKAITNIITIEQQGDNAELDFPFEKMGVFFQVWEKKNVDEIFKNLDDANNIYGVIVEQKYSSGYRQKNVKGGVQIDTGKIMYNEQKYFLTFGKSGEGIRDSERSLHNPELFIYTQTSIRGRVVGVSTLAHEFGEVLQQLESGKIQVDNEHDKENILQRESISEENDSNKIVYETGNNKPNKDEAADNFQSDAWRRRGKTKVFANADRIALFQFRIDSSYCYPSIEKCEFLENQQELNSSCAEFRRRKLLKPVLESCAKFGVEILLLPEYSVRPETVQWICERINENKFDFSVWAGTFRIPVDYCFNGNRTIKNEELNHESYWHSAPLPVIVNDSETGAEIVIEKFKKYPAVALSEDINTTPAYGGFSKFTPVMHHYAEKKQPNKKNAMPYFYDARDDVIELICAELFAVASISNYPSFVKESMSALANYKNPDLLGNNEVYEDYVRKYLINLQQFGEYTALYQREKRHIRTPILLVPACATRATDYYVFGQGFYLSAGIKTVFCNAVETGSHGGSCFIGQDSWDDKKIKDNDYLMENTIYHGLKPGIYMQTSNMKNRGALGDEEQALLICDVYPERDKLNPNAESMMSALSLIAHIPIFEEKNYESCCKRYDELHGNKSQKCKHCNNYEIEKGENRRERFKKASKNLNDFCKIKINNSFSYKKNIMKDKIDPVIELDDLVKEMKYMGETYKSEWFVKRAEQFEKYYKMFPQAWPPPALTDWIYVELDYQEFFDNSEQYLIQIPIER